MPTGSGFAKCNELTTLLTLKYLCREPRIVKTGDNARFTTL